jgi:hypothetical protein
LCHTGLANYFFDQQGAYAHKNIGKIMTIAETNTMWTITHKFTLATILAIQFAIAYVIGTNGLLENTQLTFIPPIAITVLIPVVLFLAVYVFSSNFRTFVLAQDIRTLTALQLWRVLGFTFLTLYAFEILPALFAWPAGLGDMAIGLGAAYVIIKLDRNPNYVASKGFMRFQYLGMLDFVGALGTAALSSGAFPQLIPNGLTSSALDIWPLNLFPSFIVPTFIILHLAVILKVRHMRRQTLPDTTSALVA